MATEGHAPPGVVVIGRNEGERLKRCIASLAHGGTIVYVDSGSTDGSVDWARGQGIEVVCLEASQRFTAARARNAGFRRLLELQPDVALVQFVDGDCEVLPRWLDEAAAFLDDNARVAAVCGRRRERFPGASIFNAECDREWDTPVGEARACGGDAMFRRTAFEQVGGFRDSLIAGEEPELCLRLRSAGWRIWRVDREMTLHDAAILRWTQWFRRARRTGHAFAEGAALHGATPERHWVRETRRALLWGFALPLAILLLAVFWDLKAVGLFLVFPLQVARLALRPVRPGTPRWTAALLLVLARFPEAVGVFDYWSRRLAGRRATLIEYK